MLSLRGLCVSHAVPELKNRRWRRLLGPLWQTLDAISDGTKCDALWYA